MGNVILCEDSMAQIITSRGHVVLMDQDDFERFGALAWFVSKRGYVVRNVVTATGRTIDNLHRQIMGAAIGDGQIIDHINGDKLDNRKGNLRICTNAENVRNGRRRPSNSSGFKGIYLHRASGLWHATIKVDGVKHSLGYFKEPADAHAAYCAGALKHHGEFANFG
jgi:hypothetical protein